METEIPLPALEEVEPAPGIRDLGHAKVALVTTGGLVPRGNPDGIKSYLSTHFGTYGLESKEHLTADEFESVHGGFFTAAVNEDPNRLIPLDVLRDAGARRVPGRAARVFLFHHGQRHAHRDSREHGPRHRGVTGGGRR